MGQPDVEQVRALWRTLTGAPEGFADTALVVVESNEHLATAREWVSIVRLGSQAVVVSPGVHLDHVRGAVLHADASRLTEPAYVNSHLVATETLGPAALFYGATSLTPAAATTTVIGPLETTDPQVREVLADATEQERDESRAEQTTSGLFLAITVDGTPAAVCGWSEWPHRVAHMSVLTAASQRGSGYGIAAGARAVTAAQDQGLLPQWRALEQNRGSISLARRLGLRLLGSQYSFEPRPPLG
jgi:RimJ/RimL family protein N-acetyltransferase